jgi:hypothetical protein
MAKQTTLEVKRKEAREEILALKEKIPTARILKLIGREAKDQGFLPWLINIVILNIIVLSPWLLIGLVLNEYNKTFSLWATIIFGVEGISLAIVPIHIIARNTLDEISNSVINKIIDLKDLSRLPQWIRKTWSFREMSTFVLFIAVLWAILAVGGMSFAVHEFVGFGLTVAAILLALLAGVGFYMVMWVSLLASNLKNYHYDVNSFLPVDSEVVKIITEILTKPIYITAAYFAILTLITASSLMNPQVRVIFSIPMFLIALALIAVQFLFTRSTIIRIVNNTKWETLNGIQDKINSIVAKGDLSNKETAEKLLRLVDIHKQIAVSETRIFDFKSLSTLFSQLMLPLLGLLLGNLDKILALFP